MSLYSESTASLLLFLLGRCIVGRINLDRLGCLHGGSTAALLHFVDLLHEVDEDFINVVVLLGAHIVVGHVVLAG